MLAQNSLETLLEVWDRACKEMAAHNDYVQSLKTTEAGEEAADGANKDSNR